MALTTAQIQQAYVTFFSRPADVAGLNYWSSYTGSIANLYATFAQSAEYAAAFNNLSNGAKVNLVYQNLFGRPAEAEGLNYWTLQLDQGAVTVANLALALSAGAQGSDATTVANRVVAATAFTNELDTAAEILAYSGATANAAAKAWLAGVTTDASLAAAIAPATLAASVAGVVTVGSVVPGQTFMLTTGIDDIVGTSGNDTIRGVFSSSGATDTSTISLADAINGGAGTDTMEITIGDAGNAVDFEMTSVEKVLIKNADSSLATFSAANWNGIEEVSASKLQADVTVNDIGLVAAKLSGTQATGVGLTITVDDAEVTGTADVATITLDGVTSDATAAVAYDSATTGAIEAINYVLTGTNKVDGLAEGSKTMTISGAGSLATNTALTLTLGASVYSIDGSAATGSLAFIADNGAMITAASTTNTATIKTGSAADTVTLEDALASTDKLVIDLGAGDDKLVLAGSDDLTSTKVSISGGAGSDTLQVTGAVAKALYATTTKAAITGFEKLTIETLAAATDASKLSGYAITVKGTATDDSGTLVNIADNGAVTLSGNLGGALTLAVKNAGVAGQNDNKLNITLSDVSDSTAKVVTVADVETINITSSEATATTGDSNTIALDAAETATINVSGAEALVLAATGADFTALRTLDASSATGKVTADLSSAAQGVTFKAGTGGSTVTGSDFADLFVANTGVDTITVNFASATTPTSDASTTNPDVIQGFDITKDVLKVVDTDTSSPVTYAVGADDLAGDTTLGTVDVLVKDGVVTGVTKGDGGVANALTIGTSAEVDTVAKLVALIDAQWTTAGNALVFEFGSDSYVFVQNGAADVLVKLTGVTDITDFSDFTGGTLTFA